MKRNKRALSAGMIVLIGVCALCQTAAFGEQEPIAALLEKMKEHLFAPTDFYSLIRIAQEATPPYSPRAAMEFYFFRRDPANAFLLVQKLPGLLHGFCFFKKSESVDFLNPDCCCFFPGNDDMMNDRLGFDFIDVNPALFASFLPGTGSGRAEVRSQRAFVVELVSPSQAAGLRLFVEEESALPLKAEYLGAGGDVTKTVDYLAYFRIEKKYFPRRIRIEDQSGTVVLLEFFELSYNSLPDFVFTRAYCEELAR